MPDPEPPIQPAAPIGFPPAAPEAGLTALLWAGRRRFQLLSALVCLGGGLALAASVLLATAWVLALLPSHGVRIAGLWLAGVALVVVSGVGLWRGATLEDAALARLLTRGDPRSRSLLLSAVELRRVPAGSGLSTSLIRAQAVFATAQLAALDLRDRLPDWPARLSLMLAAVWLLALSALGALGPESLRRGLALFRSLPPASALAPQRDPITGDIELTLFYPAHTRLAPKTIAGTSGELEVPAGTEVRLRTRADRAVSEASLVVNGVAQPLEIHGERQLSGAFTVTRAGSYTFRFGPKDHPIAEGPPIPIAVQADAPPQVTLLAPPETLEVDPHQVVELRYQASDDYGLSELRLVYRPPGSSAEKAVVLRKLEDPPTHLEGSARFDLESLHLMAGDEVAYALEATDNDSVAGPKAARSRPHKLKVFSETEHHREGLARARALWERLVLLLGDRLAEGAAGADGAPPGAGPPAASGAGQATDERALTLSQDLEREALVRQKDKTQDKPLTVALLNVARGERGRASSTADAREFARVELALQKGKPRAGKDSPMVGQLRRALSDEVDELERDVLYLEGLLDQATQADLITLTKELSSRRRELADLLERYRQHPTPELKAQLEALLARLKDRTADLLSRAQELAKGISDQHLNREAFAALKKDKDVGSGLTRVEDQLAKGDVEGALKELDQLGTTLDSMQRELTKSQGDHGAKAYPELTRKLTEFKDQLESLQAEQRRIAESTQSLREEARKTLEQRAPASDGLLEKLRAEAAKAKAELGQVPDSALPRAVFGEDTLPEAKDRTEELGRALQAKDLDQALHSVERALRAVDSLESQTERESVFRAFQSGGTQGLGGLPLDEEPAPKGLVAEARTHLQSADPILRSIRTQLAKLFPDERGLLSPRQRAQLGKLQQDQKRAAEASNRLSQKLDQIGREAPVFDPSAPAALEQASEHMRGAAERLSDREPGGAEAEERSALEQLDKLSAAMRGNGQGKSGSAGIPNPFAMGAPSGGSDGEGSSEGSEHEKVVVPGADQYQVPAAFRRDILDAMKQKAPRTFEEQVKHYYQEIVK